MVFLSLILPALLCTTVLSTLSCRSAIAVPANSQSASASAKAPLKLDKLPAKTVRVVRLNQESSVDGKFELLVSPVGVRIKNFKGGYELFSAAPDWNVYCVRADAREMAHLTLAEWKKFYMPSFRMAGAAANLKKPSKSLVSADRDGQKYQYIFPGSGMTSSGWSGWTEKSDVLRYEINARDFAVSPQVSAIVYRYLNLPNLSGLPVSFYSVLRVNKREEFGWLIRTNSQKIDMASASVFKPPSGMKDAGEINSQFLSRGIRGLADDMSEMLDVRQK
jgi:hypothetical protein